jgi:hypothetical protein
MKRRVEFIGGPLCGKRLRVPEKEITPMVGVVFGDREYYYKFDFAYDPASVTKGAACFRVKRKYRFLGHKAKPPRAK